MAQYRQKIENERAGGGGGKQVPFEQDEVKMMVDDFLDPVIEGMKESYSEENLIVSTNIYMGPDRPLGVIAVSDVLVDLKHVITNALEEAVYGTTIDGSKKTDDQAAGHDSPLPLGEMPLVAEEPGIKDRHSGGPKNQEELEGRLAIANEEIDEGITRILDSAHSVLGVDEKVQQVSKSIAVTKSTLMPVFISIIQQKFALHFSQQRQSGPSLSR
jgi:hypothetical protein